MRALHSALSDRAADGKVVVLESWPFTAPKTREAAALLASLELEGRVLVVVDPDDALTIKSFRNLPGAQLVLTSELNTYDVLCNDWIVFTEDTLPGTKVDKAPVAIESAPRVAEEPESESESLSASASTAEEAAE